ncbi:MAG: alanine racemase [Clostridia bacterium]|nr:alanine racemase [Clostridia bacterium]
MDFIKRAWVEISIENLKHNFYRIKGLLGKNVKVMAVLKANGYNCGDVRIAQELAALDQQIQFAVSNVEEAVHLRSGGIENPILILGYTPPEYAHLLVQYDLTQTLVSYEYALEFEEALRKAEQKLKIHIKLDTGMGRIGIRCYDGYFYEATDKVKKICTCTHFQVTGCYTHIATFYENDEDSVNYARLQFQRFKKFTETLLLENIVLGILHCLNSAGTVNMPEMQLDMVRVGTLIYGALPQINNHNDIVFRPIVTIKCRVAKISDVKEGDFIGYSRAFCADKELKAAVLTIGYSDILRLGSGKGFVLINDVACPVIGGVCMDQMVVDISGAGEVKTGDIAVILGQYHNNEIDFAAMAEFLQCGEEEVYCHITYRPTKIYV